MSFHPPAVSAAHSALLAGVLWLWCAPLAAAQTDAHALSAELSTGASWTDGALAHNGLAPELAAGVGYGLTDAFRLRVLGGYARPVAKSAHAPYLLAEVDYLLDDLDAAPFAGLGVRQRFLRSGAVTERAIGIYGLAGVMLRMGATLRVSFEVRAGSFVDAPIRAIQVLCRLQRIFWTFGGKSQEGP